MKHQSFKKIKKKKNKHNEKKRKKKKKILRKTLYSNLLGSTLNIQQKVCFDVNSQNYKYTVAICLYTAQLTIKLKNNLTKEALLRYFLTSVFFLWHRYTMRTGQYPRQLKQSDGKQREVLNFTLLLNIRYFFIIFVQYL